MILVHHNRWQQHLHHYSKLKVAGKLADTLKKQREKPTMIDEEKAESAKQREIKRQKR